MPQSNTYPAFHVAPDIYGLTTLIGNLYFIGKAEHGAPWILVDSGLPYHGSRIISTATKLFGENNPPQAVIITHGHVDHVGNIDAVLEAYPEVKVYAHPLELPFLTGKSPYAPVDTSVGGFTGKISFIFTVQPINLGDRVHPLPMDGSVPGAEQWKWMHTPGHTPGHISLFREEDRVLVAGDAVVTYDFKTLYGFVTTNRELHGPPHFLTPDWDNAFESVKRLADLKPLVVATGHGRTMGGREVEMGFAKLIRTFNIVERPYSGRYARHAARYDSNGLQFTPPTSHSMLPMKTLGTLASAAAMMLMYRQVVKGNKKRGAKDDGDAITESLSKRAKQSQKV